MGRTRKLSKEERDAERARLYRDLGAGGVTLGDAVRRMRAVAGTSQAESSSRVAHISKTALAQIERGEGNPVLGVGDVPADIGETHAGATIRAAVECQLVSSGDGSGRGGGA